MNTQIPVASAKQLSPEQYLQLLQERNRLKKKLTEKTAEQREIEERERGFVTHFKGANKSGKPEQSAAPIAAAVQAPHSMLKSPGSAIAVGSSPSSSAKKTNASGGGKVRIQRDKIEGAKVSQGPSSAGGGKGAFGSDNPGPAKQKRTWGGGGGGADKFFGVAVPMRAAAAAAGSVASSAADGGNTATSAAANAVLKSHAPSRSGVSGAASGRPSSTASASAAGRRYDTSRSEENDDEGDGSPVLLGGAGVSTATATRAPRSSSMRRSKEGAPGGNDGHGDGGDGDYEVDYEDDFEMDCPSDQEDREAEGRSGADKSTLLEASTLGHSDDINGDGGEEGSERPDECSMIIVGGPGNMRASVDGAAAAVAVASSQELDPPTESDPSVRATPMDLTKPRETQKQADGKPVSQPIPHQVGHSPARKTPSKGAASKLHIDGATLAASESISASTANEMAAFVREYAVKQLQEGNLLQRRNSSSSPMSDAARNADSAAAATLTPSPGHPASQTQMLTVDLRVRLLTNWYADNHSKDAASSSLSTNARSVALRQIALQYIPEGGMQESVYGVGRFVDLSTCTWKLLSGVLPVTGANASAAARSMQKLHSSTPSSGSSGAGDEAGDLLSSVGTANLNKTNWKAVLDSDKPLEILISGDVEVPSEASVGSLAHSSLVLNIVNSADPDAAVKDVEVYFRVAGGNIVPSSDGMRNPAWTGQLQNPKGSHKKLLQAIVLDSVILSPERNRKAVSTSGTAALSPPGRKKTQQDMNTSPISPISTGKGKFNFPVPSSSLKSFNEVLQSVDRNNSSLLHGAAQAKPGMPNSPRKPSTPVFPSSPKSPGLVRKSSEKKQKSGSKTANAATMTPSRLSSGSTRSSSSAAVGVAALSTPDAAATTATAAVLVAGRPVSPISTPTRPPNKKSAQKEPDSDAKSSSEVEAPANNQSNDSTPFWLQGGGAGSGAGNSTDHNAADDPTLSPSFRKFKENRPALTFARRKRGERPSGSTTSARKEAQEQNESANEENGPSAPASASKNTPTKTLYSPTRGAETRLEGEGGTPLMASNRRPRHSQDVDKSTSSMIKSKEGGGRSRGSVQWAEVSSAGGADAREPKPVEESSATKQKKRRAVLEDRNLRESYDALEKSDRFFNLSRLSASSVAHKMCDPADVDKSVQPQAAHGRRRGQDIDFREPVEESKVTTLSKDEGTSVDESSAKPDTAVEKQSTEPRVSEDISLVEPVTDEAKASDSTARVANGDAASEKEESGYIPSFGEEKMQAVQEDMANRDNVGVKELPAFSSGNEAGESDYVPSSELDTAGQRKHDDVDVDAFEPNERRDGGDEDAAEVARVRTPDASPAAVARAAAASASASAQKATPQSNRRNTLSKFKLAEVQHTVQSVVSNLNRAKLLAPSSPSPRSMAANSDAAAAPVSKLGAGSLPASRLIIRSASSESVSKALQGGGDDARGRTAEDNEPFDVVTFYVMSNWGDSFYIGLNGLELFDAEGKAIQFLPHFVNSSSKESTTSPSDLDTASGDPSTATSGAKHEDDDDEVLTFEDFLDEPTPDSTMTSSTTKGKTLGMSRAITAPWKHGRKANDDASLASVFSDLYYVDCIISSPTDMNSLLESQGVAGADADQLSPVAATGVSPKQSQGGSGLRDPRVITNVLDEHNYTTSDLHVWLAPISSQPRSSCQDSSNFYAQRMAAQAPIDAPEQALATISLRLRKKDPRSVKHQQKDSYESILSLIRVWNYNKSRTHSWRGVRHCKVAVNDKWIFDGEISKAPGILSCSTSTSFSSSLLASAAASSSLLKQQLMRENEVRRQHLSPQAGAKVGVDSSQEQLFTSIFTLGGPIGNDSDEVGSFDAKMDADNASVAMYRNVTNYDKSKGYHDTEPEERQNSTAGRGFNRSARGKTRTVDSILEASAAKASAQNSTASANKSNSENDNGLTRNQREINGKDATAAESSVLTYSAVEELVEERPMTADSIEGDFGGAATKGKKGKVTGIEDDLSAFGARMMKETPRVEDSPGAPAASTISEPVSAEKPVTTKKTSSHAAVLMSPETILTGDLAVQPAASIDARCNDEDYDDLMQELEVIQEQEVADAKRAAAVAPASTEEHDSAPNDEVVVASAAEPLEQPNTSFFGLTEEDLVTCQYITFVLESTWGDTEYVGLSGLEVLHGVCCVTADLSGDCIQAQSASPTTILSRLKDRITADPRDLSSVGMYDDPRIPENLLLSMATGHRSSRSKMKVNFNTTQDKNMWLIPFTKGSTHSITIDVSSRGSGSKSVLATSGIRVWNYNKPFEGTTRGVKVMQIYADRRFLGRVVLRPAPGCDGVKFDQLILWKDLLNEQSTYYSEQNCLSHAAFAAAQQSSTLRYITPPIRQDYEVNYFQQPVANGKGPTNATSVATAGACWKFNFLTNHNDDYYIGLDAIEMFDLDGNLLDISKLAVVSAVPHSLQDLVAPTNAQQIREEEGDSDDDDDDDDDEMGASFAVQASSDASGKRCVMVRDRRIPRNLFHSSDSSSGRDQKPWGLSIPHAASQQGKPRCWLAPLTCSITELERQSAGQRVSKTAPFSHIFENNGLLGSSPQRQAPKSKAQEYSYYPNNTLFVMFHIPVAVSLIRFYNYSKSPARGVNEVSIELDQKLLYVGSIPPFNADSSRRGASSSSARTPCQSVVFSHNAKLIAAEKPYVRYCGSTEQDVVCINNRMVMSRSKGMYNTKGSNPMAEGVRVDVSKRPSTAATKPR